MKEKSKRIFQLFITFFKIGAFTFGGGYAMIPLIQKEVVDNKKWLDNDDILEIIAIAESTPGPIAINSATFVGYRVAGFFGALLATAGVVIPSFVIISIISFVLTKFEHLRAVRYAFIGIRAGVLALIIKALWSMYKQCEKNAIAYIIMAAAFILAAFIKINVIWIIIGCGVFGLVSSIIAGRKAK
ncbi:MAG: chromate transporter [Ruminococcus sp.]|nr:chromate transporter [Candidatus Copronaster equi]